MFTSIALKSFKNLIACPLKVIWYVLKLTIGLTVDFYRLCIRICGFFIGNVVFFTAGMLLYALFISLVEQQAATSPYRNMAIFHEQSPEMRAELIDMARMAADAYNTSNRWAPEDLLRKGYRLAVSTRSTYGQEYKVYTKGNTTYISFRGTDEENDVITVINILRDNDSAIGYRFVDACSIVNDYLARTPEGQVVLVGHSLGGSVVQYVLAHVPSGRLRGYCFNPFGMPGDGQVKVDKRLTDIVHEADAAQGAANSTRLIAPEASRILVRGKFELKDGEWVPSFGLVNIFDQHSISNLLGNMVAQHMGYYVPPGGSEHAIQTSEQQSCPIPSYSNGFGDTL